jgi:hypothetical protein
MCPDESGLLYLVSYWLSLKTVLKARLLLLLLLLQACCGHYHAGATAAPTPKALLRARFRLLHCVGVACYVQRHTHLLLLLLLLLLQACCGRCHAGASAPSPESLLRAR